MKEEKFDIQAADGATEALMFAPGDGAYPGVLFYTDIWGIRPANIGMAKRVAAAGYAVLMPNVFYRYSELPLLKAGEERSATVQEGLRAALRGTAMEKDAPFYVEALLNHHAVQGGKIGVVGYCITGAMALRSAAMVPDKVAAAASFHGGNLVSEEADSPHSRIPTVKGELYFGHAIEDKGATPAQIARLDDTLKGWGGRFTSEMYHARHGWTVPGHAAYDESQAERHYEKLFDLLKRNLG